MEQEIKELLKRNLEVAEKSLDILQKMRRASLWGRFFHLLKWAIIIGAMVWSYLALQPYLQKFIGLGQQLKGLSPYGGSAEGRQNSLPQGDLQDLLK